MIPDLRILAVSVAQVLEYTYRLRCLTFAQAKQAVEKQRVIIDGILCKNVLHASDAVLVLVFRTGDFHEINAGRQVIGRFAAHFFQETFRLCASSSFNQEIRIS